MNLLIRGENGLALVDGQGILIKNIDFINKSTFIKNSYLSIQRHSLFINVKGTS
jgi:hypothetical protein